MRRGERKKNKEKEDIRKKKGKKKEEDENGKNWVCNMVAEKKTQINSIFSFLGKTKQTNKTNAHLKTLEKRPS